MTNFRVGDEWFGQPAGLEVEWWNAGEQKYERRRIVYIRRGGGLLDNNVGFDDDDVRCGRVRQVVCG
jgi:hypothetical protein